METKLFGEIIQKEGVIYAGGILLGGIACGEGILHGVELDFPAGFFRIYQHYLKNYQGIK